MSRFFLVLQIWAYFFEQTIHPSDIVLVSCFFSNHFSLGTIFKMMFLPKKVRRLSLFSLTKKLIISPLGTFQECESLFSPPKAKTFLRPPRLSRHLFVCLLVQVDSTDSSLTMSSLGLETRSSQSRPCLVICWSVYTYLASLIPISHLLPSHAVAHWISERCIAIESHPLGGPASRTPDNWAGWTLHRHLWRALLFVSFGLKTASSRRWASCFFSPDQSLLSSQNPQWVFEPRTPCEGCFGLLER